MTHFYFHIPGAATIGASPDETLESAILRFAKDPVFVPGRSPESSRYGEWALPLTKVIRRKIDMLVLVATEQNPGHHGDTLPIAKVLFDSAVGAIWGTENLKPPAVEILIVKEFSVSGFLESCSALCRRLRLSPTDHTTLEMGAGAATAFNGVLLGLLSVGILPNVLQLDANSDHEIDLRNEVAEHVDLRKWLVRNRLWRDLAQLIEVNRSTRQKLLNLADFESLRQNRGMNQPARHYVYSDLLGHLARHDQTWMPKVQRLLETTWSSICGNLSAQKQAELETILRKRWAECAPLGTGSNQPLSARLFEAAKYEDGRWKECEKHLPPETQKFWRDSGRVLRRRYAKFGHYRLDQEQAAEKRTEFLSELRDFAEAASAPLGQSAFVDPYPREIDQIAQPFCLGRPTVLRVRNIGTSESPKLRDAFNSHKVSHLAVHDFEYKPDDVDLSAAIRHFPRALTKFLMSLDFELRQVEKSGATVTDMSVYLNQGTKAMNLSLICSAAILSFTYGLKLSIHDLGETPDIHAAKRSTIRSLGTLNPKKLLGGLLPGSLLNEIAKLALDRLDIAVLRTVAEFGNLDPEDAVMGLCDFHEKTDGKDRTHQAAKAVVCSLSVVRNKEHIGEATAVIMIAQLLSGVFSRKDNDPWKVHLEDLWTARNQAVHLRKVSDKVVLPKLPVNLDKGALTSALSRTLGVQSDSLNRLVDDYWVQYDELYQRVWGALTKDEEPRPV